MSMDQQLSLEFIKQAIDNPLRNEKCCDLHTGTTCLQRCFNHFLIGSKSFVKLYFGFLFAQFLFARRKKLLVQPKEQLKKFIKSFIKSILFGAGYLAIVRAVVCLITNLYANGQGNTCLILVAAIVSSTLGGSSLILQPAQRQPEIALFIFTNTLQTLSNMAKRRNMTVNIPYGTSILYVISLSIICYHYFNNKQSIRSGYISILDKLLSNA